MTRRVVLGAACLVAAGCGSSAQNGPGGAAQRFVSAVAAYDRARWCPELSGTVLGSGPGPLEGHLLNLCLHNDIFLAIGSCDRETAVADGTVSGVERSGNRARVRLTDRAVLRLRRVEGRWLVTDIQDTRVDPRKLRRPHCGSRGGAPSPGTGTVTV